MTKQEFIEKIKAEQEAIKKEEKRLADLISSAYNVNASKNVASISVEKLKKQREQLENRRLVLGMIISYPTFKAISNLTEEQLAEILKRRVAEMEQRLIDLDAEKKALEDPMAVISKFTPDGYSDLSEEEQKVIASKNAEPIRIAIMAQEQELANVNREIEELNYTIEEIGKNDYEAIRRLFHSYYDNILKSQKSSAFFENLTDLTSVIQYLPGKKALELASKLNNNPEIMGNVIEAYSSIESSESRANSAYSFRRFTCDNDFNTLSAFGVLPHGATNSGFLEMLGINSQSVEGYEAIKRRYENLPMCKTVLDAKRKTVLDKIEEAKQLKFYKAPKEAYLLQNGVMAELAGGEETAKQLRKILSDLQESTNFCLTYSESGHIDGLSKEDKDKIRIQVLGHNFSDISYQYRKLVEEYKKVSKSLWPLGEAKRQLKQEVLGRASSLLIKIKNIAYNIDRTLEEIIMPDMIKSVTGFDPDVVKSLLREINGEKTTNEASVQSIFEETMNNKEKALDSAIRADYNTSTTEINKQKQELIPRALEYVGKQIDCTEEDVVSLCRQTIGGLYSRYNEYMRNITIPSRVAEVPHPDTIAKRIELATYLDGSISPNPALTKDLMDYIQNAELPDVYNFKNSIITEGEEPSGYTGSGEPPRVK